MKFYTLQNLKAWNQAKLKGYLEGNKEYADEEFFSKSYLWMMEQMSKRLKHYNEEYPIWLWVDPSNINCVELLQDEWVILEVNLSNEQVLLSNFEAWHIVLNDCHLDEENLKMTKEKSWECIFDKGILKKLGYGFDDYDLQAVTGKIELNDIKVIKYIVNKV